MSDELEDALQQGIPQTILFKTAGSLENISEVGVDEPFDVEIVLNGVPVAGSKEIALAFRPKSDGVNIKAYTLRQEVDDESYTQTFVEVRLWEANQYTVTAVMSFDSIHHGEYEFEFEERKITAIRTDFVVKP